MPRWCQDTERHADEKHVPPVEDGEDAADQKADKLAGERGNLVEPQRLSPLIRGRCAGEDRGTVGEDKCRPDRLDKANTIISIAPASQYRAVRKKRREPRVRIANPMLYSLTLPFHFEDGQN